MSRPAIPTTLLLTFALVLAGCGSAPQTAPAATPESQSVAPDVTESATAVGSISSDLEFTALRDEYFVMNLQQYPVVATYLGGGDYSPELADIDSKLKDYSQHGIGGEVAGWQVVMSRLEALDPTTLNSANRIDHAVMTAQVAFLLRQLADRKYHQRAVDSYVAEPFRGVDWQIQGMTDAGDGLLGTEVEWDRVIARLQAVPAYVATAQDNLAAGKAAGNLPDRRMVERDGISGGQANAGYFQTDLVESAQKYLGDRPFAVDKLAAIQTAGSAAADAYTGFVTFLGETYDVNETTDRYAAGTEEYDWRVRNNLRLDKTAAELYDYAESEVASIEAELFTVAAEVAKERNLDLPFGTEDEKRASTLAVLDSLSDDSPKNDDELFTWYRDTAASAVQYGRDENLFDVPADYKLDIVETPPVLRSTISAAYYPAPPFKDTGVGRFYLTPTGNDPAQLKLNPRSSVADTAVHEGFPGHDWHYKYMTAHRDGISNIRWLTPGAVEDSSAMWEDSMPTEGWALYVEDLMAQPAEGKPHGFYSAAEHLYELDGQLWRAVRVRVDTGLHTGRMTYDEALDYFTAHKAMYPGACQKAATDAGAKAVCDAADREIYRYSKWPTQAITYNLGKHAVLDLREAYKAAMGEAYDQKTFHEKYMGMGTIPPGYFAAEFSAPQH